MSGAKAEAKRIMEALAARGIALDVDSYLGSHKVVPAGQSFFGAGRDSFRADSWAEIAAYLGGMLEGYAIGKGERPDAEGVSAVFEGKAWYVILPDGDTFDTVHGAVLIQVPATVAPEDVAELRAHTIARVPLCSALVDLFGRGKL